MERNILSEMQALEIVFDEFTFKRHGGKTDNEVSCSFNIEIWDNQDSNTLHKVILEAKITKESEYDLCIAISGVFQFNEGISDQEKQELLNKNAVAILLPYVRSQVAILTAQPGTDSVTLPVLNISNMMSTD